MPAVVKVFGFVFIVGRSFVSFVMPIFRCSFLFSFIIFLFSLQVFSGIKLAFFIIFKGFKLLIFLRKLLRTVF